MIVDVHSHYFRYPEHFTEDFKQQSLRSRNGVEVDMTVRWEDYHPTALSCDKTIVFGGKAKLSGMWVPDQPVAEYVSQHPDRLIGFLSLDPMVKGWQDELEEGHKNLGMKGIKLMPMYAGFRPDSREIDHLWQYASKNGLPVLLHTGTTFIDKAPLECTLPRLLDNVANRFPDRRGSNPRKPGLKCCLGLLDVVVDREQRHVHRDHDEAYDRPDHDDHYRLEDRGQSLDRGGDLVLVELGDLLEHRVECA